MSFIPSTSNILSSDGSGWIVILSIIGVIVLIFVVSSLVSAIQDIPRKRAAREREKVKTNSALYRELESLNSGKRSIKGKKFQYRKNGYAFVRTYKEWQEYGKADYFPLHRSDFENDLLHLTLFIDDCTIYRECVDKIWKKFRQDPASVAASGLPIEKYAQIEDEICQSIILPEPPKPVLEYDIVVECGYQRRKKHLRFTQEEIEGLLKPEESPTVEASSETHVNENERETTATFEGVQETVAVQSSIKQEAVQPSERVVADKPDIAPIIPSRPLEDAPAAKAYSDSFNLYFDAIKNLDQAGYFWAKATEKEREVVKALAFLIYASSATVSPVVQVSTFGFRKIPAESEFPKSVFWFQKPKTGMMLFSYFESSDSSECKSIAGDMNHLEEIKRVAFELIARMEKPIAASAIQDAQAPVASDEDHPKNNQGAEATINTSSSTDAVITSDQSKAEAFERYFASIEGLEEDDFLWLKLSEFEQAPIKEVARLVFDSKARIIPKNQLTMFCFKRIVPGDAVQHSIFWFKKPKGKDLTFTFRESPDSDIYHEIPVAQNSIPKILTTAKALLDGKTITDFSYEKPTITPTKTVSEINHDKVIEKFPSLAANNSSTFYSSRTPITRQIIDEIILLASSLSKKVAIHNGSSYLGFGRSDDLDNGFQWFGFRQRLGENMMFFYKENRYSGQEQLIIANTYNLNQIVVTVRRLINDDFARPIQAKKPEQAVPPVNTHKPSQAVEPGKAPGILTIENLEDRAFFFGRCSSSEKAFMKSIIAFIGSYDLSVTASNTQRFLGFRRMPKEGGTIPFWFWFTKVYGSTLKFVYRPSQDSSVKYEITINDSKLKLIEEKISKLLTHGRIPPANPAGKRDYVVPQDVADFVSSIGNRLFFFETLDETEKDLVIDVVREVRKLWNNVIAANTKSYFGFRTIGHNYSPYYWFWFAKPKGGKLQFVYRIKPNDGAKNVVSLESNPMSAILEALALLKKNEHLLPGNKGIITTEGDAIKATTEPAPAITIWDKPFLYATEIIEAHQLGKTVKSADISALCTIHHFTYLEGGSVAFNNKYKSFPDAIYQSKIVNSENKIYMYSNPYSSTAYDRALVKLQDELKIFDLGEGRYLTMKALETDDGISYAEAHKLKERIKKYLGTHSFFSLDNLRESCADCRFLEFATPDRIMMQFVHSIFGRGVKTIITDQDSPKSVFSTGLGEIEMHKFFVFITENAESMDIYAIKDRVETLFAINYSLDLIGKDAERAGFFYSEDLEKVYKHKKYFYKEIQQ